MKMVNGALNLRIEFDVPVEVIAPGLVQVIGRKAAPMILELPARRTDGLALDVKPGLPRRAPTLLQIAGRAGGRDILPGCPPALGARDDMIEGQFLVRPAIDAAEAVTEKQVEPGESGIFVGP